MKATKFIALAGLLAFAAQAQAQTVYNARVVAALTPKGGKWRAPLCALPGGDFHTSSAGLYLKTAVEGFKDVSAQGTTDSKKYNEGVNKALKSALDGIAANPKSAAAWYYYGAASLQLGDLRGADSAFNKVEALSPDCAADLKGLRQTAWLALVTPSSDFLAKHQNDSAFSVLRDAQIISRYYPQGFYNLAATFVAVKQYDSAIVYFKLAQDKAAGDPQFAGTLKNATYNLAYLYSQMNDNANAIVQYRKFLTLDPNDPQINDVKRALAVALRSSGNTAEAADLEKQLMASGALSTSDINGVGARYFQDKNYPAAADAFQKILTTDPGNHDALYNLAMSYYAMKDAPNLTTTAQKLLDIDPYGSNNMKLLANGYQLGAKTMADTNKWADVVMRMQKLPLAVTVNGFNKSATGAKLTAVAMGLAATDDRDKPIAPAPLTLTFEFLDASGAVVVAKDVDVPALAAQAKQDIVVEVPGANIASWRYHKK